MIVFADRTKIGTFAIFGRYCQEDPGCFRVGNEQRNSSAAVIAADGEHLRTGASRWHRSLQQSLIKICSDYDKCYLSIFRM